MPELNAPAGSTTISTKRQVVLPSASCDRRGWTPGTRLIVEDRPDGLLLRSARLFPETTWEEVYALGRHDRPPLPVEALNFDPEVDRRACDRD